MKPMTGAFHQLYYHYAWRTKDGTPSITGDFRDRLLRLLADECIKYGDAFA